MHNDDCDVKQRLLTAAKRLFALEGFDAASVRQICEEAGANVALVSYHFGGKEQLFKAIYDHYFRPERFQIFEELKEDPVASMKAFIEAILTYRFEEPEMSVITMREIASHTKRTEMLKSYLLPVWQVLKEILANGKSRGIFRIESVDYTMTAIMGMLLFPPRDTLIISFLEKPFERDGMIRHMTVHVFRVLGEPVPQQEREFLGGGGAE